MRNETYMQEGMDLKRVLLLLPGRIWLLLAAVFAGAVIGGGGYLLKDVVFAPERSYEAVSKIYLDFDTEPENLSQLSYNGYTWNDLLDTDPIMDETMAGLTASITREEVAAATKAEILSDIRLLTVTVTTASPELTGQIMEATQKALVRLGETDKLFRRIEVYSSSKPAQVIWDNRTEAAVITGAVIGAFLFLAAAFLFYVLDDGVYVTEDVRKRYGLPAFGILSSGGGKAIKWLDEEIAANVSYLCRGKKTISVVSLEHAEEAGKAVHDLTALTGESDWLIPESMQAVSAALFERLRERDGIVLALPFGRKNGKLAAHMIGLLKEQNCGITGVVITGADGRFLKRYYFGRNLKKTGDNERK